MNHTIETGFFTALGTPLEENGRLAVDSFARQISDQIASGAAGLLALGSMGILASIRDRDYLPIVRSGAAAAGGRTPFFVGVMDTSASRVIDRAASLTGLPLDGIVATVPFYYTLTQHEIEQFFRLIAAESPFPVYLYDLPAVTKTGITTATMEAIIRSNPNIRGMKSGNLTLARSVRRFAEREGFPFTVFYSGLETFDIAYRSGIDHQLDGMFACTAPTARALYSALASGNGEEAAARLDSIVRLRDCFAALGIFPAFSAAMNLLGYEGRYHPDYSLALDGAGIEQVRQILQQESLL